MTRKLRNRGAAASLASTTERNDRARHQSKFILNRQAPLKGSTTMSVSRFLQIHSLHSYPAALLNRDDSGLAKRMPFGGVGPHAHLFAVSQETLAHGRRQLRHPQHPQCGQSDTVSQCDRP